MSRAARILVVDDDPAILVCVSMALEDEGYDVQTATNGVKALEAVQQSAPTLILLDMRMPVMDGWAFARAYRELPTPHVPIIVLTAARDAGVYADQVEAAAHLAKPFDLNELLHIVAHYTGRG